MFTFLLFHSLFCSITGEYWSFGVKRLSCVAMAENQKQVQRLGKNEIHKVIDVWKENITSLRASVKNSHVYQKMCDQLKELGVVLTTEELRNRINNLTKKYRAEVNKMGTSGGSPSTWAFFNDLHQFLSGYKQNRVVELMEESLVNMPSDAEIECLDEDMELVHSSQMSSSKSTCSLSSEPSMEPSSSKRSRRSVMKTKNVNEKMLEIAERDSERFAEFMEASKEVDKKMLELMRENNRLVEKLVDKI
nr:uncharacterized protein LOC109422957 isoform X1 [Aedes albopictus]